jgi:hypothetical protein
LKLGRLDIIGDLLLEKVVGLVGELLLLGEDLALKRLALFFAAG